MARSAARTSPIWAYAHVHRLERNSAAIHLTTTSWAVLGDPESSVAAGQRFLWARGMVFEIARQGSQSPNLERLLGSIMAELVSVGFPPNGRPNLSHATSTGRLLTWYRLQSQSAGSEPVTLDSERGGPSVGPDHRSRDDQLQSCCPVQQDWPIDGYLKPQTRDQRAVGSEA